MTHKVFKFGSRDLIRFIEIYRNNDCLWDIQNSNYKSRDARNAALKAFAEQFDVEGFGPKEITAKIKNLRTQYHGEKRKIKDSMETGDNIYQSKLPWYSLMDSFLGDTCEYKKTIPNMNVETLIEEVKPSQDIILKCDLENIEIDTENNAVQIVSPEIRKIEKKTNKNISMTLDRLDGIGKRARLESNDDDIEKFGKYIASSLRTLKRRNCIMAQDEIQSILSKYKVRELEDHDCVNTAHM